MNDYSSHIVLFFMLTWQNLQDLWAYGGGALNIDYDTHIDSLHLQTVRLTDSLSPKSCKPLKQSKVRQTGYPAPILWCKLLKQSNVLTVPQNRG